LSDFFVRIDGNDDRLNQSLWRILDILFGNPFATPTFDEFAMFMAFSAALRSADLARQVGAVVARDREILATGANDCPRFGGGLYWPEVNEDGEIVDVVGGRDHTRGVDANKLEQRKIIDDIVGRVSAEAGTGVDEDRLRKALADSPIGDITEYGRVVHAEMEALLSCARGRGGARGATLYSTTFPCHNCAKHIVAAGIRRVVYIEPYPKSKAAELHSDSVTLSFADANIKKVRFEAFIGVGPRRFFDLFSMRLSSGHPMKRKSKAGERIDCQRGMSRLRMQMLPCSYLDLELAASEKFEQFLPNGGEQ
jgi:deoxycytidylate deaminase